MSFKNNSPTFSYISWQGCYITYDGVDYIIEDGYSCQHYIYWNYNNPYKFETTNLLQDETITKQLIAVNDRGMASVVELDNVSLTFTESGSNGMSSQITDSLITLYERQGTNKDYEDRFTTIEIGLDEITTSMGELEATNTSLSERISTVQQTAENVSIEVSDVKKEYSKDKETMELRDSIGEALLIFNSELGLFTSDLNNAMKDNSLSTSENTTLTTRINNLTNYKNNIDTIIGMIINKINNEGGNTSTLREEKTVFGNSFNSLITLYNSIVIDNAFTTTEITTLTNAIGNMNTRCIALGNVLEDILLTSFNGKLIEEISKFSIKSNEITLGISEIEKSVESNSEKIAELKITSEGISSNVSKIESELQAVDEIIEEKIINITIGATNLLIGTSEEWREITVNSVGTIKKVFHCSELELNVGDKIAFGIDINAINKDLFARMDFWSDFNGGNSITHNGNVIEKGVKGRSIVISEIPDGYEYIVLCIGSENTATTTEFFKCEKLERGSMATDWSLSPKDTETRIDDALSSFMDDWEGQIDGVIQTYAQSEDPSDSWSIDEKEGHEGDIWYDTVNKNTYRWDGTTWIKFENEDAILASELAQTKAQIFISTPTPPYYQGDIWITDLSGNGVVKTCVNERLSGNYDTLDWIEGLKYTDDTKANEIENDLHGNYSTTVEMHSAINQTAEGVLSTVSKSYYTKNDVDGQINLIQGSISEIKQTSDSFSVRIDGVENNLNSTLTNGTSTQYYLSTSETTLTDGSWQDTAPKWTKGKYMWQRMKYTYVNGTTSYGNPVCIAGAKGENGTSVKILGAYNSLDELNNAHPNNNENGDGYIINSDLYIWVGNVFENVGKISGEDGEDGKTSYFHVKYSDDGGQTFTSNNGETAGMYIGTCVDFNEADPVNTTSYKWALIKGEQGINGVDGVDGKDGTSIVFKGSYSSHPSSPKNGWAYYNTTEKKSYVYQSDSWYQMTIDGVAGQNGKDGLSLEYKGELTNPPSNPSKNWAYKDIDNGIVYIYTGSYWEVLTYDGSDGIDGVDGQNGNSVFITYNSSTSNPSNPTGSGATNGWHTTPTDSDVWMSQKVAEDIWSGVWGTPIKIKGDTGQSLVSSTPQWYKSTSSTTQTGGSWEEAMPNVEANYYIWLRYKQIWENPTATTYTTPVLEQVVESVKSTISKQSIFEQNLDGITQRVSSTESTLATTNNKVETINNKVSEVVTDLNGITQRVSSTEDVLITTNDKLDNVENKNLIHNSSVLLSLEGFKALGGTIRRYEKPEEEKKEDDILVPENPIPSDPKETPTTGTPSDGDVEDDKEKEPVTVKPPTPLPITNKTRIHFILTVECGDCILIETDSGKNILIDAPDSRLIDSKYLDSTTPIISYLDNVGVTTLDYVICTHFHSDHAGALPAIMQKYCNKNSKLIYNDISDSAINAISKEVTWKTVTYKNNVLNMANTIGMTSTSPSANTVFTLDDNTSFKICKIGSTSGLTDYNGYSLAVVFIYKGRKVLLSGDINPTTQSQLINAIGQCDIVKDPHHGYNSRIDTNFIETVNPKDVIVTRNYDWGTGYYRACNSVGMWQSYEKRIYTLFHTNDHIIIDFDRNDYTISTSKQFYFENCWLKFNNDSNCWCYFKQGGKCARNETLVLDGKRYDFGDNGFCSNPYNPY